MSEDPQGPEEPPPPLNPAARESGEQSARPRRSRGRRGSPPVSYLHEGSGGATASGSAKTEFEQAPRAVPVELGPLEVSGHSSVSLDISNGVAEVSDSPTAAAKRIRAAAISDIDRAIHRFEELQIDDSTAWEIYIIQFSVLDYLRRARRALHLRLLGTDAETGDGGLRDPPERAATSNDANLEPEWALPAPGFIPMPEPDPFAEGFADDDGFSTPGPSAEDLAAEARRARDLRRRRTQALVREVVETSLLCLLVFLAIRASFQKYVVDGTSMFPTLHNGQLLIVNQIIYAQVDTKNLSKFLPFLDPGVSGKKNVFHGPARGDVIILVDPPQPNKDLVKRVIGLPGETIQIVSGAVYINDRRLNEPYIKAPWHADMAKLTIPEGEYFVMGDNRDNSLDSRGLGTIPASYVIGQAVLSFWPMDRFGLAPNEAPTLTDETVTTTKLAPATGGR